MIEAECAQTVSYALPAVLATYSVFEFWIGKTKKTKANSFIELAGIAVGFVIVHLIKKPKGGDNGKTI